MKKTILSRLLVWLLLFALLPVSCFAETAEETSAPAEISEDTATAETEAETSSGARDGFQVDYTHLRVANPTPMTGHFFTSMWGASTSDLDVQELLHRYKLVVYDNDMGRYRMNPLVVNGTAIQDDEQGNRTYYFSICDDLTYSDGSPITSKDYAFTLLLMIDPAVREAGGIPTDESWILGEEDYVEGRNRTLRGVRIMNDYLLAVTVKADALPYFYELSRFRISPYPIQEIAPDCEVLDDGDGVYLTPRLTGDLLRRTILDSYQGYMIAPRLVTGPYTIEGFRNGVAHLLLNPLYKGNQKGETPAIPELTYSSSEREDISRGLETGELGLVNKIMKADTIQLVFDLMEKYPDRYRLTSYPRTGLTVLRFMPRSPRVQETAVRQAVFNCLDREGIVDDYTGGFGMPVKGMYGVGQWMVRLLDGPASYPIYLNEETATPAEIREYERELEEWQAMNIGNIPDYELDPEKAKLLLEENGWTLDRFGDPYESGVRYKRMENGQLVGLDMTAAVPENLRTILEENWLPYMEQAGFGLELISMNILDLAETYRRNSLTDCDMVIVGEDFTDKFRLNGGYRQYEFSEESEMPLEILDNEIDQMSQEVYYTDKLDLQGFLQKWLDTQIRIAETVPVIPLYSNVYFDFYIAELRDYQVENYLGWGNAIVAAWLGDAEAAELAEEEPEFGETETEEMEPEETDAETEE